MKPHSTLNCSRDFGTAVTINSETFIFGGRYEDDTYEYLPKDSDTWILGKSEIPDGISLAFAIAIESKQEILLIGGREFSQRILKFNVKNHTFEELSTRLLYKRYGHKCAFIPGTKKIIITGGSSDLYSQNYSSMSTTEILDTEDYSITVAHNPMNFRRTHHGIGIMTFNDEERLAVFGGLNVFRSLDCVEVFNTKTFKWEMTDIKLSQEMHGFGYLSVNHKYISKLKV